MLSPLKFRRADRGTHDACREDGWIMLTLLLAIALLIIFAAAIVPSITFEIKRDREEEMIHRGVQYSRAIKGYYKKFGRYPVKIEDLENTSNIRFLRKRYKDPMNCKNGKCEDFKLLHFGEVQLSLGGINRGAIAGATPVSAMNGGLNGGTGSGTFGQTSSFGGNSGFGGNPGFGGNSGGINSTSSFGQSQPQNQAANNSTATGQDASQTASQAAGSGNANSSGAPGSSNTNQLGGGQIIGGPIIGVASVSKEKTIREFNHKNKYKDWMFVYDPAQDVGRLITTPYQPQLQGFGSTNLNGQNGTQNTNGVTGPGFGNSSGFGNSPSGMQNNPSSPVGGTPTTPNPPANPQQQ